MLSQHFQPLNFDDLPGWTEDNHLAAFNCFQRSATEMKVTPPLSCELGLDPDILKTVGALADKAQIQDKGEAREFFETHFRPFVYNDFGSKGLLTAYFEPELPASRTFKPEYPVPIYKRPEDLVGLNDINRPKSIPVDYLFGKKVGTQIVEYYDRNDINRGILSNRGLELFWLKDPVDCYFTHIQGSARLQLDDGSIARISYAAKSGHPYTAIGKVLVDMGEIKLEQVTMQSIKDWLYQNPDRQMEIMGHNRSYIFFRTVAHDGNLSGPIGAGNIALTAGRSLAIDKQLYPFGLPFWVKTKENFPGQGLPLNRLMIAQDTGSAIVGAQRGDFFVGSGTEAGQIAGQVKHEAMMIALLPVNGAMKHG